MNGEKKRLMESRSKDYSHNGNTQLKCLCDCDRVVSTDWTESLSTKLSYWPTPFSFPIQPCVHLVSVQFNLINVNGKINDSHSSTDDNKLV
jgi:hypothetical protein